MSKHLMTDVHGRCTTCDSTDGWLLETVVDHDNGFITSQQVPCPVCLTPQAQSDSAPEPLRRHSPKRRKNPVGSTLRRGRLAVARMRRTARSSAAA
jgi:hypothetical protein